MTPQQILDTAYLGLKAQGKKSLHRFREFACAYRGKDGTKCGVGMLIDDETGKLWDYMTSSGIVHILSNAGDSKISGVEPWMVENIGLLVDIQLAHDVIVDWGREFEVRFTRLYKKHSLVKPETKQ